MGLQNRELLLFHTNDIHSNLDNVARIQTIMEQYRLEHEPDQIVLVDIGDFMDRMSLETEGTDGLVHRDLLNYMKYDVITLGNNEGLSFTHNQLSEIYKEPATFKVVCCNMKPIEGPALEWLYQSTIIEKNGLKLGFIGVTINYTSFYRLLNWDAQEPIQEIKQQISQLKDKVDVLIVMSHLGIRLDEQLVKACPEIDILFGAHTHHVFNPPEQKNQTLMCAAGMGGAFLGVVHISAIDMQKKPNISGKLIPTHSYTQSQAIISIIEQNRHIALNQLEKVVATLDEDIETDDFNESSLPNLLALSISKWCGTPLAIVNSGQILAPLQKGNITLQQIHAVCPSPINACILKIKGSHIRQAFTESLQHEYKDKRIRGYGFRGVRLGYLAVAGFKIYYNECDTIEELEIKIYINDELLNDDKIYNVATIDMFTFKQGYTSLSEYEDVQYFVPEYIRHILANSLTDVQLIEASKECHWINMS